LAVAGHAVPQHPVAAPAPLVSLLSGPVVRGRVASVGRLAAYVVTEHGDVVGVVRPEAVVPPCAVLLPASLDPRALLRAGEPVSLGQGWLRTGAVGLRVARWWHPRPLPTGAVDRGALARATALMAEQAVGAGGVGSDGDPARAAALAVADPAARVLADGDGEAAGRLLGAVLGLGPGTTPSGDDVACGLLVGARAFGLPPVALEAAAAAVLHRAATATTAVSGGLLAEAAAGRAPDPVLRAVDALLGCRDAEAAVTDLLAVGHTSGADLATGLLAAATAALGAASDLSAPPHRRIA
jgi:hypothetical protein